MKFFDREQGIGKDLALLGLVFGVLYFQFLGRLPLIDPDEGRYVEIPREMLERGDFITPTLNYVKYFEKPPLHYWLNAISLAVFGENEFAARFAGTLCGLATVLLTYYLGRKIYDRRAALISAGILGTAGGFLVLARINYTDMTLTFFLSAAFAFFMLASREGAEHRGRNYCLFYIFMALAVLAKGLIGIVLPGGVILAYLAFTKRWRLLREMRLGTGILVFLAVAAPWFVLVSLRNPEFPQFFFIHEHFQRFLTKVHHRYQPPWFFIPILAATLLPWSPFIPAALKKGWQEHKNGDALYLLLWAGVIFAFFSKSNSKLVPYILPVFPPLALLIGNWFREATSAAAVRRHGIAVGSLLLLLGAGAIGYPLVAPKPEVAVVDGAIVGGLFLVEGVVALWAGRTGNPFTLFASLGVAGYLFALAAPPVVYARMVDKSSVKTLSLALREKAGQDAKIACYMTYEQGVPFYTHRRAIVVGDRDELQFGSERGDNTGWYLDRDQFHRLWDSGDTVFATLRRRDLSTLQQSVRTPVRVVAVQGKEKLLVCNREVTGTVGALK
ncbi:phospholipid carrier-dependent glycosyltransferase [Geomesophilobacter sediminis]|uniref:Glycosyltransferase family 39 protein n=1 Tax=Geomesophilobacter sediminis TaxID=2798584 RepID=A0A8J7IVP8_9BACT|nr:glycosyltransferase family 39 protein [Geomesophilobacter sediminis]MBJ6723287.1 glycosyltransferase family 39 protein [Geomesophilobacter sediminis]